MSGDQSSRASFVTTAHDEYNLDSVILRSTKNSSFADNLQFKSEDEMVYYSRVGSAHQKAQNELEVPTASMLKPLFKQIKPSEQFQEIEIQRSSKAKVGANDIELEELEVAKTQKRHRRHGKIELAEEPHQKTLKTTERSLPLTSAFIITEDDRLIEKPSAGQKHSRMDSNQSSSRSARHPSSSIKSSRVGDNKNIGKIVDNSLKKAISKVKLTIKGSKIGQSNTLTQARNPASLKERPGQVAKCTEARSRLESTINSQKNKTMDIISKKIATLIKQSGDMKFPKVERKDSKVSSRVNSRESLASSRAKPSAESRVRNMLTQTIGTKNSFPKSQISARVKKRPLDDSKHVSNISWQEKIGINTKGRVSIEEKLTTSNYSCSNLMTARTEYLRSSGTKRIESGRENPYLCTTNRSSVSNSRLSSRGTSMSAAKQPQPTPPKENPASLKRLLKQIYTGDREQDGRDDSKSKKKPLPKPVAVPSSPFIRMKPKNSLFGLTTSQKLK